MIFMIGVWYKKGNTWEYKRFTANKPTYNEEYRIMNEFASFVNKQGNPKLWYWCAEKRFWERSENRQFERASCEQKLDRISNHWKLSNWTDMLELFKK